MKLPKNCFKNFYLFMIIITCSAPAIFGFCFIENYAVNVPYSDQWDTIVTWTIQYYEGNFDLGKLIIDEQNDSRPAVPSVILLIVSLLTNLNIKTIFYFGYIFYIISIIFLIYFIKNDTNFNRMTLLLIIPIFYYAFNPYYMNRFIENMGSVQYPIMILTAMTTIYSLYISKKSYFYFLVSIAMGLLCTFSYAAGLSIWLAGLIQLGIQEMNNKKSKIIVWIISAILIFYIYFVVFSFKITGPHGKDAYSSYFEIIQHYPIHKFLCVMGAVGSEVIHQKEIALYFGVIIYLVFAAILYVNHKSLELDRFSRWYGLLVFGTLTSIEVALTRSGDDSFFGAPDNIFWIPAIRHSLAIFLPILCIYILTIFYAKNSISDEKANNPKNTFVFCEKQLQNVFLLGIIFILLSLSIILHVMPGIDSGESIHNRHLINQYYLSTYRIQPDENLKNLHPSATVVREKAALLEKYNLSIFGEETITINKLLKIKGNTYNSIDKINNNVLTKPLFLDKEKEGKIEIAGWAVDKNADGPASAVYITIDDRINIPSIYGLDRPDVAKSYKNRNFRYSGFRASFASSILDEGTHNFTIKIVSKEKNGYYQLNRIINFTCI